MQRWQAGDLIHGGAVATALRAWFERGRRRGSWRHAERVLRELFPQARPNSIAAVLRIAKETAAIARVKVKRGPTWVPPIAAIPDARRLLRDAERAHQAE